MSSINPGLRTNQSSRLSGAQGPDSGGLPTDLKPASVGRGGPTLAQGAYGRDESMGMHKPARMLEAIALKGSLAEMRLALRERVNAAESSRQNAQAA
jgi:hypothetical protein